MSDSSRHNLSAIVELVYGTTPATPNFKRVRHTGTTLGLSKSTFQSEELRADRQITDYRHGAKQTGGDIGIELSYGNFDDYLEAVLGGTWARKASKIATTISAARSDSSINDSGNGFITAGFEAGDRITISGFTGSPATVLQVETATAVGTITGDGNAAVVVTGAGIAGSPITLSVAVLNGDTPSVWAGKVRTALAANAAIAALYTVGGAGASISLTRISEAISDGTLNISLDNDTCTGITTAASSANTTAGVVGNNKQALIATVAAGKLTLTDLNGVALLLTDDAAGESVTVLNDAYRLKAGVVRRSFSFLREFADIVATGTNYPFHKFAGQEFSKFTLNVAADAMIKGTFSLVGKGLALSNTEPSSTMYTDANTKPSMDAFAGALKEGGVTSAVVTEIQMTLDNGITPRFVVGSDETILPSIGRSNLSGQVTAYFENSALVKKFIDATESSIQFTLGDPLGNKLIFTMPRVKFNGGQPDTQGQGPITLTIPFQALLDATGLVSSQIAIDRLPVAS